MSLRARSHFSQSRYRRLIQLMLDTLQWRRIKKDWVTRRIWARHSCNADLSRSGNNMQKKSWMQTFIIKTFFNLSYSRATLTCLKLDYSKLLKVRLTLSFQRLRQTYLISNKGLTKASYSYLLLALMLISELVKMLEVSFDFLEDKLYNEWFLAAKEKLAKNHQENLKKESENIKRQVEEQYKNKIDKYKNKLKTKNSEVVQLKELNKKYSEEYAKLSRDCMPNQYKAINIYRR